MHEIITINVKIQEAISNLRLFLLYIYHNPPPPRIVYCPRSVGPSLTYQYLFRRKRTYQFVFCPSPQLWNALRDLNTYTSIPLATLPVTTLMERSSVLLLTERVVIVLRDSSRRGMNVWKGRNVAVSCPMEPLLR